MKTTFYTSKLSFIRHGSLTKLLILIICLTVIQKEVSAQNFHLLKDINTSTDANPSNPNNHVYSYYKSNTQAVLNGIAYFGADDGANGRGLWRSDGTPAGTYQVKDGVNPQNIIVSGGKLYFQGKAPEKLWVSDGTDLGTKPIFDSIPYGSGFTQYGLTDFKGAVYFIVNAHGYNEQLWKTDGTVNGTVLVKDFYEPFTAPSLFNLIVIKNKLYFNTFGDYGNYTFKLWVSDGSERGTHIIGLELYDALQLVASSSNISDSLVYFTASPVYQGDRSLYVTNGDSGNVSIISGSTGIVSNNYYEQKLIEKDGDIFFLGHAAGSPLNNSLYKYDANGTNSIQPVKIVTGSNPKKEYSNVSNLYSANGTLYFKVFDAPNNKSQLWKSNGTSQGNVLLEDNINPGNFFEENGIVYFIAGDNTHGYELWKTDGSVHKTGLVKDIKPGLNSSNPDNLVSVHNQLLFSAQDGIHGNELWQTDGTSGGTSLVKDINQITTASASPRVVTVLNNSIVFLAYSGEDKINYKLWKSNGTNNGTLLLSDTVYCDYVFNNQDTLAILNNEVYFFGITISGRHGLYKSDGTSAGTVLVKDFSEISVSFFQMIATDNLIYFTLTNASSGKKELWRTDGSSANTYVIKDDFVGLDGRMLSASDSTLFFYSPSRGSLWKTDGTIAGTIVLTTFANNPLALAAYNNSLFFTISDGKLWKSGGTPSTTLPITDKVISPSNFFVYSGELFFTATGNTAIYGNIGRQLFKTDGTDNGTVLLKQIQPGMGNTYINKYVILNGIAYFFTNAPNRNLELWKSNGTSAGTELVSSFGVQEYPYRVASCNSKMFFIINNILWESDGTNAGTHTVADNILNSLNLQGPESYLACVDNHLFFSAYNYQYGQELYTGIVDAALPVKLLSFTGALQKTDGLLKWSTANEQDNSYFNLQRSTDGIEFKNIAKIKGAGNTSTKTDYSYTDINITQLGKDKVYYRLQQVDHDGTATLSNIVVIDITKTQPQFFVAPNPARNSINIYSSASVKNAEITVLDMNGKKVYTASKNIFAGQPLQIESAKFARGLYVVTIGNAGSVSKIKVVKE